MQRTDGCTIGRSVFQTHSSVRRWTAALSALPCNKASDKTAISSISRRFNCTRGRHICAETHLSWFFPAAATVHSVVNRSLIPRWKWPAVKSSGYDREPLVAIECQVCLRWELRWIKFQKGGIAFPRCFARHRRPSSAVVFWLQTNHKRQSVCSRFVSPSSRIALCSCACYYSIEQAWTCSLRTFISVSLLSTFHEYVV